MSKDQKNTKEKNVEIVDKLDDLKLCCRIINEVRNGFTYWGYDKSWPFNLYFKSLQNSVEILNSIIFTASETF